MRRVWSSSRRSRGSGLAVRVRRAAFAPRCGRAGMRAEVVGGVRGCAAGWGGGGGGGGGRGGGQGAGALVCSLRACCVAGWGRGGRRGGAGGGWGGVPGGFRAVSPPA